MTRVTIYKNKLSEYTGVDLIGHAGYAEAGEDIVCSAISVLVINTINSIERFTNDQISCYSDEESGEIQLRFSTSPSHEASLLLDSMVLGLQFIEDEEEYESYIDIIFKEV